MDQVLESPNTEKEIQFLAQKMNKNDLLEALQNILKYRDVLEGLLERFSGFNQLIFNLKKYFRIEKYLTEQEIISENFKEEEWEGLIATYIKKTDGQIPKKFLDDPVAHLV